MPEFYDIARHYDDVATHDAYNMLAPPLFNAQFSTFVEAAPDGSTASRRVLSLAPELVLPARRAIRVHNEVWIVGTGLTDMFQNVAIRTSYWMKKTYALFSVFTPAQACTGVAGVSMYGHRMFHKNTVNSVTDAGYEPFWHLYFGVNEVFQKGLILRDTFGTWYRCRVTYTSDEGFRLVEADQLDPPVSVTYGSSPSYDPELDVMVSTPATVTGFVVQGSKFYEFFSEHDVKYQSGDCTLITPVSLTPESNVNTLGRVWRVADCVPYLDGYASHVKAAL